MDYSVHMLARSEHDLRVRSLPTVHDFDNPFVPTSSRWARLLARIRAISAHLQPSPRNQQPITRPALSMSIPSNFLRQQIQEDWNRERDWLWAASQVTHSEEIHYCLERALYMNPKNRDTRYSLSRLVPHRVADEMLQVNSQSFDQVSES